MPAENRRQNQVTKMYTLEQHIDDLARHIQMVQTNARLLAASLIEGGRREFARVLLSKASVHDASKWSGIEWDYLHQGDDVDKVMLKAAITQHQKTNDHHPEFWGGIDAMPEICVAEMVCDWRARSQEFGTDVREFITNTAYEKFGLHKATVQAAWVSGFIQMLLPNKFAKI